MLTKQEEEFSKKHKTLMIAGRKRKLCEEGTCESTWQNMLLAAITVTLLKHRCVHHC